VTIGGAAHLPEDRRAEVRRWTLAGLLVLATHTALVAGWVLLTPADRLAQGAPVVLVDLAPLPAAPVQAPDSQAQPETQTAPEPDITEPPPETQTAELQPAPQPEPPPVETPQELPPPETPQTVAAIPHVRPDVPLPEPTPPPQLQPRQASPKPPPAPRKPDPRPRTKKPPPAQAAQAAAQSPVPAASRAGISAEASAAQASWRELLMAHLQRNKRYPGGPQQRREQGTATLSFTMDRAGRVVERHLAQSSGNAELDAEVLAMITRAQPLPAFPPSMTQARMTLNVPIRFSLR
jgi:protein TonB